MQCFTKKVSPVQLQHEIPSALVTGAAEQLLPPHVSCQDPLLKYVKQQSVEFPDLLVILALSIADFR